MSALEWRSIPWADGYEVSEYGQVRSWLPYRNFAPKPTEPRLLKHQFDRDGYVKYRVYIKGVVKDVRACALVAELWHGLRPVGFVVRHLDGSRSNDHFTNLKWGTPQENSDDAKKHGTVVCGENVNTAKLTKGDVIEIKRSNETNVALAKKYCVTPGAIWHIRDGRTWKNVAS